MICYILNCISSTFYFLSIYFITFIIHFLVLVSSIIPFPFIYSRSFHSIFVICLAMPDHHLPFFFFFFFFLPLLSFPFALPHFVRFFKYFTSIFPYFLFHTRMHRLLAQSDISEPLFRTRWGISLAGLKGKSFLLSPYTS